ncbi:hypothetical protein AKG95_16315 [Janthinobacterium lividum]|uniref:Flagellar protein FliT n=1 Tax=Janthinobacterium lividum TaxID=29581 RepID=A0A1S1U792_9BURK|nr:hypothetical protein [Janthinobacterium lividum]OHV96340.1 hypothetical protein AKG95_16315 [Janthinobacterium lividum]
MDSSPLSLQLTREVLAATAVQNWDALEVLDRKLAQHLAGLGILSEREKAALLALRKAHAQAYQACSDEKHRLGMQLGEIHSKQEGWVAYAIENAMYQDENPA